MDEHEPWRPKIKRAPLFNPFEASTEWTAQIGGADRIVIEDEEPREESVPASPASQRTNDKSSAT